MLSTSAFSQKTWVGGNGFWHIPANWSPGITQPSTSDEVIISSGNPKISTAATCAKITVNAPISFSGSGSLSIYGDLNISNSTYIGGGTSGTVLFRGGASNIKNDCELYKVTVNKTGDLTLDASVSVTINYSLKIQNSNVVTTNSSAKLILNAAVPGWQTAYIEGNTSNSASVTGGVYVRQYVYETYKTYHHLSPPVHDNGTNYNSTTHLDGFTDQTDFYNSGFAYVYPVVVTIPDYIYYDETEEDPTASGSGADYQYGWKGLNPVNSTTNRVELGQGVCARFKPYASGPTAQLIEWYGDVNNQDITTPDITYTSYSERGDGYNLIGNPYPSPIDWQRVYDDIGEFPVMGIWQNDGGQYSGSYLKYDADNNSNSTLPDGIIAIGQGFFVEATSTTSQNITFQNSYRVGETSAPFYRKAPLNAIDLKLTGLNNRDLTLIHFDDYNESDKRPIKNLSKWMNPQNSIYTLSDGEYNTALNLPFPKQETQIPLGFAVAESGEYAIEDAHIYLPDDGNYKAYLEDRQQKSTVEITPGFRYNFVSDAGRYDDRFIVRVLNRRNVSDNKNGSLQFAYLNNAQVFFQLAELDSKTVNAIITDASGRNVWQGQVNVSDGRGTINIGNLSPGILFVRIADNAKITTFTIASID